MTRRGNNILACILACSAFTCWVGFDVMLKLASRSTPVFARGFAAELCSLLMLLLFYAATRQMGGLRTRRAGFHLLRGLVNTANILFVLYSVARLPLANFYVLAFLSPFFIAIAASVLLKEKTEWGIWAAIAAGFAGVVIAVRPEHFDAASWPPLAIGGMMGANLCYTFYSTTVKYGAADSSAAALAFYPELVTAVAFGLLMLLFHDGGFDGTGLVYASLGGVMNAGAVMLITLAYRRAANAYVASFHYTQIISGAIAGYVIWGDRVTGHLMLGVIVIIAAGLYIIWHGAREDAVKI